MKLKVVVMNMTNEEKEIEQWAKLWMEEQRWKQRKRRERQSKKNNPGKLKQ